jgi:hypothetical protein
MHQIDAGSYSFNVTASHNLYIVADITPWGQKTYIIEWRQTMQFTNAQQYLDEATQTVRSLNRLSR